jgi:sugar phosphate permease
MPDPGQAAPMSAAAPELTDSLYAAFRLGITLALMTIGNCGMYAVAVMLPAVQAEFGVARADASLPYTLMMVCFGVGGVLMGKLADRFGVMLPLLIGLFGSSATFAPLVADTSLWFVRRHQRAR